MNRGIKLFKSLSCDTVAILVFASALHSMFSCSLRSSRPQSSNQQQHNKHTIDQSKDHTTVVSSPEVSSEPESGKPHAREKHWSIININIFGDSTINVPGIPIVSWKERVSILKSEVSDWLKLSDRNHLGQSLDIMTLQETISGDGVNRPQELADALGLSHATFAPAVRLPGSPNKFLGNAILTRDKPLTTKLLSLPSVPGLDEPRSVALVRLPSDLVIVTTHLAYPKGTQADRLRWSQIVAILDFIERHTSEKDHIVFTGDLNSSSSSLLALLTDKNFRSVHAMSNPDGDRSTWTSKHPIVAHRLEDGSFLRRTGGFPAEANEEFDYAFISQLLSLTSFNLILTEPNNGRLITDHFGLAFDISATTGP